MGKDLKGRELGLGISQRKDGTYTGRYTNKQGKRIQKYFKKLQECKKWMAEIQFQEECGTIYNSSELTVDAWFNYWLENIKGATIKPNTRNSYTTKYNQNIKNTIGNMLISEVKTLHCQAVLNSMSKECMSSTIRETRTLMSAFFEAALCNDIIKKNPINKNIKWRIGKDSKEQKPLTIQQQIDFLKIASKHSMYNQFSFVLQTGLRVGELNGLKWSDIDFKNKTIIIQRNLQYYSKTKEWSFETPKTQNGKRTIPLTQEAIQILENQLEKRKNTKSVSFQFNDLVFLTNRGNPVLNQAYTLTLKAICKKMQIQPFGMHLLRHTFATRCIEAGIKPKTLQVILGHSNISITMNLYVHLTEDEKILEMNKIEEKIKVV